MNITTQLLDQYLLSLEDTQEEITYEYLLQEFSLNPKKALSKLKSVVTPLKGVKDPKKFASIVQKIGKTFKISPQSPERGIKALSSKLGDLGAEVESAFKRLKTKAPGGRAAPLVAAATISKAVIIASSKKTSFSKALKKVEDEWEDKEKFDVLGFIGKVLVWICVPGAAVGGLVLSTTTGFAVFWIIGFIISYILFYIKTGWLIIPI